MSKDAARRVDSASTNSIWDRFVGDSVWIWERFGIGLAIPAGFGIELISIQRQLKVNSNLIRGGFEIEQPKKGFFNHKISPLAFEVNQLFLELLFVHAVFESVQMNQL